MMRGRMKRFLIISAATLLVMTAAVQGGFKTFQTRPNAPVKTAIPLSYGAGQSSNQTPLPGGGPTAALPGGDP
ncbi:MAG: hypothetical protein N2376_03405, partial [Clostridia bacterium]|nr:hypothetical protein [Clostridia bacterium]